MGIVFKISLRFLIALVLFFKVCGAWGQTFPPLGPNGWDLNTYTVLTGDYNADGIEDIYLKANPRFVPIAGDILIPIFLPSEQRSYVLLGGTGGSFVVSDTISLNEATLSSTIWQEGNYVTHLGDFNGDNLQDFFLQGQTSLESGVVLLASNLGYPSVSQTFSGQDLAVSSVTILISDQNGDGKSDLIIQQTGGIETIAYANNFGAFPNIQWGLNQAGTFVASTNGGADVDSSGAASYKIPLTLPNGIQSIQPNLEISYNSRGANGLLGVGWQLSGFSSITRCAPTLEQDGYNKASPLSNEERFCIDGQKLLVEQGGGVYGSDATEYTTEIKNFDKVISYGNVSGAPNHFKVWGKNGLLYFYGNSNDSRVEAQGKSVPLRWALNRVEDRFGNYYKVSYLELNSTGEHYPTRIDYTGNDAVGLTPNYSVRIEYADRPSVTADRLDRPNNYRDGSKQQIKKLIKEITSFVGETRIRAYKLSYELSPVTALNRLDFLTECGYDIGGNVSKCARSTNFDWQDGMAGFSAPSSLGFSVTHQMGSRPQGVDADGDGFMDIIWINTDGKYVIAWGNGNGFDQPQVSSLDAGDALGIVPPIPNYRAGPTIISPFTALTKVVTSTDPSDYRKLAFDPIEVDVVTAVHPLCTTNRTSVVRHWSKIHFARGEEPVRTTIYAGGVTKQYYANQCNLHQQFRELYPIFGDFNSDGLVDVWGNVSVSRYNPVQRFWGPYTRYSIITGKSNGDVTAIDKRVVIDPDSISFLRPGLAKLLDFNGDGYLDVMSYFDDTTAMILINNNGLEEGGPSPHFSKVYVNIPRGDGDIGNGLVLDINSDGLQDYIVRVNDEWNIYVNNGKGGANGFNAPISTGATSGGEPNALPIDYDGDGLLDLLVKHPSTDKWRLLLTVQKEINGELQPGFKVIDLNIDAEGYADGIAFSDDFGNTYNVDETPLIGDINGDGLEDIIYHDGNTWKTVLRNNEKADLLVGVTDGFGKEVVYEYSPLYENNVYDHTNDATFPQIDVFATSLYVVNKLKVSNGVGGYNATSFHYKGAKMHFQGRGFLGFNEMSSENLQNGLTTTYHYSQDFPYIGAVEEVEVTRSSGQLMQRKINNWNKIDYDPGFNNITFPYIEKSIDYQYDLLSGDLTSVTVEDYTYNNLGGLEKQITTVGEKLLDTLVFGIERKTTVDNNLITNTDNWLLNFVDDSTITYEGSMVTRVVTTDYEQASGSLALTSKTEFAGTSLWRKTEYLRNGLGITTDSVVSGADISTRTTLRGRNYLNSQYPRLVLNALSQPTIFNYDLRFGVANYIEDANLLSTTKQYDVFGRLAEGSAPDGTKTLVVYNYCQSGCPANAVFSVTTLVQNNLSSGVNGQPRATVFYDSLRREVRRSTESLNGQMSNIDTEYYPIGYVKKVSQPYFANASSGDIYWTEFSYDELGRTVQKSLPDGGESSTVYGLSNGYATKQTETRLVINPDSTSSTQIVERHYNVLGQISISEDANDSYVYFGYNSMGQLDHTTVSNGDIYTRINIGYDIAGNKDWMSDPDAGYMDYEYNALGQLKSQTDAKSQTTSFTYDLLGRAISKVTQDGTSTWVYDSEGAQTAIGQLMSVAGQGKSEFYEYDSLKRLIGSTTDLQGHSQSIEISNTYDDFSRVLTVSYPSGITAQNRYSSTGYKEAIIDANSDEVYWEARESDAYGNITIQNYAANGLSTIRAYDPASGRIEAIITGTGSNGSLSDFAIQDLSYQWDSSGNLHQRRTRRAGNEDIVEDFTYDILNRLKTSTTFGLPSGTRSLSINYDPMGNIIYKSDVGTLKYGSSCPSFGPHAVCGIYNGTVASEKYEYDANGNMTATTINNQRSITYDASNMPTQIVKGSATTEFKYGPSKERYYQKTVSSNGSLETFYVGGGAYEEVRNLNTGIISHKSYVGGVLIHTIKTDLVTNTIIGNEEKLFLHNDHLGSTESITNLAGNTVHRFAFDPWGARREDTWEDPTAAYLAALENITFTTTTRGFTGHEMLDEVELIHMNGRMYDQRLGRFLSPDLYVQAPNNTQSYNRYSYVMNNPLSLIDPSGYTWWNPFSWGWGSAFGGAGSFFRSSFRNMGNFFTKGFGNLFSWGRNRVGGLFGRRGSARGKYFQPGTTPNNNFPASGTNGKSKQDYGLFAGNSDVEEGYQRSTDTHGSKDSSLKLSEDLTLNYTTSGPTGFASQVELFFREINGTDAGNSMLKGIAASGQELKVFRNIGQTAATSRSNSDFQWDGTTIALDPSRVRAPRGLFESRTTGRAASFVSPVESFSHELFHAWQNTSYWGGAPTVKGLVNNGGGWENSASNYTNIIRQQLGIRHQRVKYK